MKNYRDLNDYEIMYLVEENDDAKELLLEKYKPIIINMAIKYQKEGKKMGLELDDLIQEGYMGFYSAIKNYNPDGKAMFYTYAILSIKSKILNCIKKYNTYKHRTLNQSISLSQPISSISDTTFIDLIVDDKVINPEDAVQELEISQKLKPFLYSLDIESAAIFELSLNGFSNVDIHKVLDYPLKNVANILFHIRKKFEKCLQLTD